MSLSYARNIKTTANYVEFDEASVMSNLKPASRHCFGLLTFLLTSNNGVKCARLPLGEGTAHKNTGAYYNLPSPPSLRSLAQRLQKANQVLVLG